MHANDTIVAVSSPPGRSARGLIRVSGVDAVKIMSGFLDTPLSATRTLTPAKLRLCGSIADLLPTLVSVFRGPASFTGQALIELQCPGNPALLERIVRAVVVAGARLAEPGEFSFRAFLAGKIDLTQAEGIAETIAATSDAQLRAAAHLREGKLGQFAASLVSDLATQLALVEAGIDFVDQDDVVPIGPGTLDENLASLEKRLSDLLANSRSWGSLDALPRVVLVGAPSTGKSTLFNALLGQERAVTSSIPGTTRDVLAEPLTLGLPGGGQIEVMLVDIAGLDTPAAMLDREAQAAARRAVETADLILAIDDGNTPPPRVDAAKPVFRVRTKSDTGAIGGSHDAAVSAWRGEGLAELKSALASRFMDAAPTLSGEALALNPRHESALRDAASFLAAGRAPLAGRLNDHALSHAELIAGDLRRALDALACIGGQMSADDVIGRVFAAFCVGK